MEATTLDHSVAHRFGAWIDVPLQSALCDWQRPEGPLYDQLAVALRDAIEEDSLPSGSKLPPERILAGYLGVGRRTVARAYEILAARGLVERRQGSGTTVLGAGGPPPSNRLAGLGALRRVPAEPDVDLLELHPPADELLQSLVRRATNSGLKAVELSEGYVPQGYEPLRNALAGRLTAEGIPTDADQVLVTSGAQQAISMIASTFVHAGQIAVLEDPTLPSAIDAFRAAGARMLTVPVRNGGADVASLAAVLARNPIGVIHLMPTFQTPTGAVMSAAARRQVVELARLTRVPVVENLTTADLGFAADVPPPLATCAGDAPVLSVGSFSQVFWSGLRVGWIRGPRQAIAHLSQFKAATDLGTSTLTQALATALLDDYERMREHRRATLADSLQRWEALLGERLPDWDWRTPAGGSCLWVRLPLGSAIQFAQVAREHGVAVAPGPVSSATNSFDDHLRLPLLREPDLLEQAVSHLAAAWHEYAA